MGQGLVAGSEATGLDRRSLGAGRWFWHLWALDPEVLAFLPSWFSTRENRLRGEEGIEEGVGATRQGLIGSTRAHRHLNLRKMCYMQSHICLLSWFTSTYSSTNRILLASTSTNHGVSQCTRVLELQLEYSSCNSSTRRSSNS